MPWNKNKYTVVGYDKDNDVYVPYVSYKKFEDALIKGKELAELVKKDKLIRENGEPIDWIQIYEHWNTDLEAVVWGSYLDEEEKAI